jgi:hypothetical protein
MIAKERMPTAMKKVEARRKLIKPTKQNMNDRYGR